MEKMFKKHESIFSIALIVNTIMSILIISLIISIKRVRYYGLTKINNLKEFLYFIYLL